MLNINELQNLATSWLMTSGFKIVIILVGAYVAHIVVLKFTNRLIKNMVAHNRSSEEARKKREDTLVKIVHGTVHIVLYIIVGLMLLSSIGMDIAPLLAAAGIAGLAFGFGGQYLIKDVISGLFIILENQYRVNDVVCFDGTCGLVEDITLRMTTLRDLDGTVHHVPHGAIIKVSNLSKYYARVNLNLGISYNSDLEKVINVVNRVGNEMSEDPAWKDMIIKPPQFLRVDDFADSAVVIKILGETKPIKQWDVTGELRKRLKIAFDKEGIEIPFPQRVIHQTK
jgi:small conductance mechanosensitive channel